MDLVEAPGLRLDRSNPRRYRLEGLSNSRYPLLHFRHNHVVGINHLVQMNLADFREQLVRVHLGEAIVIVYPSHQLRERDP